MVMRFLFSAAALAFATWVVPGIRMDSSELQDNLIVIMVVAAIFGVVNAIVGTFIRVVAFPIYVITLGLISFIVNGLLLLLVDWISGLIGFGLHVEGFWWGVLGALVLGLISWLIGLIVRPSKD